MRRTVSLGLLLVVWLGWAVQGRPDAESSADAGAAQSQEANGQAQKPLNNDSIIWLVQAGLGEDTIITMVKTQAGHYMLGASDILTLKKAGVSEKVIKAMLDKSASAASPAAHAQPISDPAPPIPSEIGLYAFSDKAMQRIEGRVTSFERSGSLLASAVTLGIHASRVNVQIPGTNAHVTVGARPVFYYRQAPKEQAEGGIDLVLTAMTVQNGRRQFEVAAYGLWRSSKGVSARHQLNFDATQIEPGLYKLTPTQDFTSGQYAFYLFRGREHESTAAGAGFVYDFQVE